jgi:hypothetical protein
LLNVHPANGPFQEEIESPALARFQPIWVDESPTLEDAGSSSTTVFDPEDAMDDDIGESARF